VVNRRQLGRTGLFDDPTAAEEEILRDLGLDLSVLGFNKTYRMSEATLEENEEVSVHGEVDLREVDGQVHVVMVAPADGELLVSDAAGVHG
jgi:hypothetical protein